MQARDVVHQLTEEGFCADQRRIWAILADRGVKQLEQYEMTGEMTYLQEAVGNLGKAASITAQGIGNAGYTFGNLGVVLLARFQQIGKRVDLDQAIKYLQSAFNADDPLYPKILVNLANALLIRFKQFGNRVDLDQAVVHFQNALDLTPHGHPEHSLSIFSLACALKTRYQQVGDPANLDKAINYYRNALVLTPPDQPLYPKIRVNLANALLTRFKQAGNLNDVNQAIEYHQAALNMRPPGHRDRSSSLTSLANALLTRFSEVGDLVNLDHAIFYYESALDLRALGHPERSSTLFHFATALLTRFNQVGDRADLDQSIVHHRSALDLRSTGHPLRSSSLDNLASALLTRFEQIGDPVDLDQAIGYLQIALNLRPTGHPDRSSSLVSVADALQTRFQKTGDCSDLDVAFDHYQKALDLMQPGHPFHISVLNNIANVFFNRFRRHGDHADLDKAIEQYGTVLDLRPSGHPLRAPSLANLANSLLNRFHLVADPADLDLAITYQQRTLNLRPPGHPEHSSTLLNLANLAIASKSHSALPTVKYTSSKSIRTSIMHDDDIISLLREATSSTIGGSLDTCLRASLVWVDVATQWSDPSATEAYRISLGWLETVLATGRSLESRHLRLSSVEDRRTRTLALDGAAFALNTGQIEVAVELLEQGRSVLLTQAGKYRTRVDELREIDPILAKEFLSISRLMENLVISTGNGGEGDSAVDDGDVVAKYQKFSQRWMGVVNQIRCLQTFESFLRPTPFKVLQTAAAQGPVILLNISQWRSDAIIIHSDENPLLVSLPQATPEALARLAAGANAKSSDAQFKNILRELWEHVVQPIVHALQNTLKLEKGSRIWWCPTAAAAHLPIHAAGIYTEQDQILPNIYISSYTSTLSALISAREINPSAATDDPNLLVVGQAHTPGQIALPSINREVEHIKDVISSATIIAGSEGTREAVLDAMQRHSWMHIACHGHVNQKQPFRSHFSLQNGPVTLLDIAGQNLPKAELAFLAACHSAQGNIDRPDEVLHLAAGLQFAGVRSVIGTLWAMCDNDGPTIAQEFYKNLVGDKSASAGSSAHALHRAITTFRARYPSIPSSRWACFVHYGR